MFGLQKRLGIAAISILFAAPSGEAAHEPPMNDSSVACTNWCTANASGTEHKTSSTGVGISDAATHDWQSGTCDSHHIICTGSFASAEKLADLERSVEAGDVAGIEAIVSEAPLGALSFDREEGKVTVFDCAGRTVAVMFATMAN